MLFRALLFFLFWAFGIQASQSNKKPKNGSGDQAVAFVIKEPEGSPLLLEPVKRAPSFKDVMLANRNKKPK